MNKQAIIDLHKMNLPAGYMTNPEAHLNNIRDKCHIDWSMKELYHTAVNILDIGAFDFWLLGYLCNHGYYGAGIEVVPELCQAARLYQEKNLCLKFGVFEGEIWEHDELGIYDALTCYEMLEHVQYSEVPKYLEWFERHASKMILISLPDQDVKDNPQHRWTPDKAGIHELFGNKKGFKLEIAHYENTAIPANFFVRYTPEVK